MEVNIFRFDKWQKVLECFSSI